jgi:hypothetical protein
MFAGKSCCSLPVAGEMRPEGIRFWRSSFAAKKRLLRILHFTRAKHARSFIHRQAAAISVSPAPASRAIPHSTPCRCHCASQARRSRHDGEHTALQISFMPGIVYPERDAGGRKVRKPNTRRADTVRAHEPFNKFAAFKAWSSVTEHKLCNSVAPRRMIDSQTRRIPRGHTGPHSLR